MPASTSRAAACCWGPYRREVEPQLFPSAAQQTPPVPVEHLLARLPKLDFHCHLNGSISPAMLAHMEQLLRPTAPSHAHVTSGAGVSSGTSRVATACRDVLATATEGQRALSKKARMQHCFQVFDNVYTIMTNLAFTRLAVQDMLLASAAENIMVTEIRTSLRGGMTGDIPHRRRDDSRVPADMKDVATKEDYVWAVISTVEHILRGGRVSFETGELIPEDVWRRDDAVQRDWHTAFARVYGSSLAGTTTAAPSSAKVLCERLRTAFSQMHVRLLVSINRAGTVDGANEAVAIAKRVQRVQVRAFHDWCVSRTGECVGHRPASGLAEALVERLRSTCWVTGMDLSGNCYRGELTAFLTVLERARAPGCEEDVQACPTSLAVTLHAGEKLDAGELAEMVAFRPERWGHLVFTDETNLARLLADHGGIELCITSNLLTGGHEEVREHHLTRLVQQWRALSQPSSADDVPAPAQSPDAESPAHTLPQGFVSSTSMVALLTGEDGGRVYAHTDRLRRLRRLARWSPSAAKALVRKHDACALPNVSFHTDDRGVFQTSLTHELYLAAQHPAVYFNDAITSTLRRQQRLPPCLPQEEVRRLVQTMWALQRLALRQLFELPWTVWELVFLALTAATAPSTSSPDVLPRDVSSALLARRAMSCDWGTWPAFVRHCRAAVPSEGCGDAHGRESSVALPVAACLVEQMWLTWCFDAYRLVPGTTSAITPRAAASALEAVQRTLQGAIPSSL